MHKIVLSTSQNKFTLFYIFLPFEQKKSTLSILQQQQMTNKGYKIKYIEGRR